MDDSLRPTQARGPLPPARSAGEETTPYPPPDLVPMRLVLKPGPMAVELYESDVLFGRHSQADVRLPLPDVSRHHCRFVFTGGQWYVFDQNSLNGVFVNDERVKRATLKHGDEVRIGGFTFVVDLRMGKSEPPARREARKAVRILRNMDEALPPTDHDPLAA